MITFEPHTMQGQTELTPELRAEIWEAAGRGESALAEKAYELMVQGAEIGVASISSKSSACFSDCPTHNLPAYLPGLCDCEIRR